MSTQKLGRNDLCHCGSGKKYKKCHLTADEAAAAKVPASQRFSVSPQSVPFEDQEEENLDFDATRPWEFPELESQLQDLLGELENGEQIQAAIRALEPHVDEFDRLATQKESFLERVSRLFEEERFAPARLGAREVREGFGYFGYPPNVINEEEGDKVLEVLLHLADDDRRARLAKALLSQLPDLVQQRRFLDGCIVLDSAIRTVEDTESSNPFFFNMFRYGFDAWTEERVRDQATTFAKLGLNLEQLRRMSPAEVDAAVRQAMADPSAARALEEFYNADAERAGEFRNFVQYLHQSSTTLLKREDAKQFLLRPEDIDPWWPGFLERLNDLFKEGANNPTDQEKDAFLEETLSAVIQKVFTPERVTQLHRDLIKYRDEHFAAGDRDAATLAGAAANVLNARVPTVENYFLRGICRVSLYGLLQGFIERGPG